MDATVARLKERKMTRVSLVEAQNRLPELIEAVAQGEDVVITRDDRPVAKLVPVHQTKPRPRFGSAKGLITMSDDFDAPMDDFREYME
jgi:prevent-host-death family protein